MKIFYAILHKPSGMCLPEKGSRKGKGGYTKDEPDDTYPPRMFPKKHYAQAALRWWLKGKWNERWNVDSLTGEEDPELVSSHVPSRIPKDMRIISVTINYNPVKS